MQLQQRINAFVALGTFFSKIASEKKDEAVLDVLQNAKAHNRWFTDDNLRFSFKSWGEALTKTNLETWLSSYTISEKTPKTIAIVMAGNVPMVGFHDFISVLLSGHHVLAKLSSNDTILWPFITKKLIEIAPQFESKIVFTEGRLEGFDAVIATGSNNTARYFDYYFGKYPNIIRKNRNSVAVLTGSETKEQLEALADDVFRYFGLGCRNVSKIYVPKEYNFHAFFNAMFQWKHVINDNKYINNYDYNKAVYLMSLMEVLDNEFMILKEDEGMASPISVVFYETYDSLDSVASELKEKADVLQCIVSTAIPDSIPFGTTQTPALWDYADGVDTMQWLLAL